MTFRPTFILPLILLSSSVTPVFAQAPIGLSGHVTDPDRAAVVGAPVTATPLPTGTRVSTRTGDDGTFTFPSLAPGRYQLEISAAGFAGWTQDITIDTEALNIDATLQIATLSEDITVRANAIVSFDRQDRRAAERSAHHRESRHVGVSSLPGHQ